MKGMLGKKMFRFIPKGCLDLHLNLSKNFSSENPFILVSVHFPNIQKTFCGVATIYQMPTKD